MEEGSPAAAFLEATRDYLFLPSDPDARLAEIAARKQKWKLLFNNLLEIRDSPDPSVRFALGQAYRHGWGAERDLAEAIDLLRQAAHEGHSQAMVQLALVLRHPERQESWDEGLKWLQRAADLGDPAGMVHLGFAYREGQGVEVDYSQSSKWFSMAYEAGDKHSAIHVGRLYAGYIGDPPAALKWFRLAAEAGQSESFINLAMLHDHRGSELYDPAEAVKWYQSTVAKEGSNLSRALYELAAHYRDGIGVPRSNEIARCWLARLYASTPESNDFHQLGRQLEEEMDSELF